MERAPLRPAAETVRQSFLLAVWVACLTLLLVYAPNRIWNAAAGKLVVSLGAIAAWRYSWWALHLVSRTDLCAHRLPASPPAR